MTKFILSFFYLGLAVDNRITIVKELSPLTINEYCFIKLYIILYLLSPFLNIFISKLKKEEYKNMLIVLFIILCLIPFFTNCEVFSNNGHSLYSFIHLYLIGGYLRKYPIQKSYIFKPLSKRFFQILLISIFIIMLVSNFIVYRFALSLNGMNEFFDYFANMISKSLNYYNNPFIVLQSIAYFCFLEP